MDTSRPRTTPQIQGLFTPSIDTVEADNALAPLTEATNALMRASLAGGTIDNYTSAWRGWQEFCRDHGFSDLPAEPRHVALYLAMLGAEVTDGAVSVDADGNPLPGRLRPNTVAHSLSAINKAHNIAGHREPGQDETVSAVLRGLRRSFGSAPLRAKAAIDLDLLERLLDVVDARPAQQRRDLVILLLSNKLRLSAGQIARSRWPDMDFGEDGTATVEFASATVSPARVSFELRARPGDDACLIAALQSLRELHPDAVYVLEDPTTDRAMTRQGVVAALRRLTGNEPLDELALRRLIRDLCTPTLRQRRDRCILLTGWYAALRRSNLVWARWTDLRAEECDWELTLRRTKTNIDGAKKEVNWLNQSPGDWPCPATAMTEWRTALAAELGRQPGDLGDLPVFVQIDRHGNVPRAAAGDPLPLSGDAVCDLIQELAAAAGLTAGSFGGHSLRAGFITEALTDDKASIAEVQDVTHHVDINVLADYRRLVNGRKTNATQRLFAGPKPGSGSPAPVPSPPELMRKRRQR